MDYPIWDLVATLGGGVLVGTVSILHVVVSVTGATIVTYSALDTVGYYARMVAANGGALREISSEVAEQADPNWSPDGQSILYGQPTNFAPAPGSRWDLYRYELRTGKSSRLPDSMGLFSPRWSPDGRYFATSDNGGQIFLYDATGRFLQSVKKNIESFNGESMGL